MEKIFQTGKALGDRYALLTASPDNEGLYSPDDIGLGYLFADVFKDHLLFVKDTKRWYFYNGRSWEADRSNVHTRQCAKMLAGYLMEKCQESDGSEERARADMLRKRTQRETMIKEAQDIYPIDSGVFDANPMLLNCQNCTLDLTTMEAREHDPTDLLTKMAYVEYNPEATSDGWNRFIREIMREDEELAGYLQKAYGYSLSGDISEECLFILYGPTTRNGKGTITESIGNVLGDYACTIQADSLAQRRANGSGASADIARLAGVRYVNASELPNDMKLNAALVKQFTGGDRVTARHLYQNFTEFRPQFKIFISTNHLPEITDDSLFASRRLRLIPFDKHFDEDKQDRGLKNRFREENVKSAILNWLLEGYHRYKEEGLEPPAKTEELLRNYRESSDVLGLYIEDRLESCDENHRTKTKDFHDDFIMWCKNEGVSAMSLKGFVQALRQKGLLARDRAIGHYIRGYKLKA